MIHIGTMGDGIVQRDVDDGHFEEESHRFSGGFRALKARKKSKTAKVLTFEENESEEAVVDLTGDDGPGSRPTLMLDA